MKKIFGRLADSFRNRPLQFKFNFIYLCITLCVSILSGFFVYRLSSDALLTTFSNEMKIRLDVMKSGTDKEIENTVNGLLGTVIRHWEAARDNKASDAPISERALYYQSISELSANEQNAYFFYDLNGLLQYTLSKDRSRFQASNDTGFYTDFLKSTAYRRVEPGVMTSDGYVVRIGHLSRTFSGISEYIAYDYHTDRMETLYRDIDDSCEAYSFVLDGYGTVISATDPFFLGKKIDELGLDAAFIREETPQQVRFSLPEGGSRNCYLYGRDLFRFGWKYLVLIPESTVFRERNSISFIVILEPVIFFLLSFLIMLLVNRIITRPLNKLTKAVDEAEPDLGNISFHEKYDDEIGRLARSFKRKNIQIEKYITDIKEIEEQVIKARYQAYQAQLNPHMLYNTFSTIIWLIENDKDTEAINALESLSTIMRAVLDESGSTSTVRREIGLVESYMQIQEYRYGDKFRKIILVDEEIKNYEIPSIVLQSIVENAIYHGIKLLPGGGLIVVRGYGQGDDLIFEVRDNGPAGAEELAELNEKIQTNTLDEKHHGLRNIHLRLVYEYGNGYGLSVAKTGGYTVFTMKMKKNK